MRNCVLDIIGEVVIQILTSETMDDILRETRNTFLDHLQEHLLDTNAYVRSKVSVYFNIIYYLSLLNNKIPKILL